MAGSPGCERSSLQWSTVVQMLTDAAAGVMHLHSHGIVHRDLKPNNIMLGSHGEVKVMDWGLARVMGRPDLAAEQGDLRADHPEVVVTDRSRAAIELTQMGAVAGTPAYMPPEQARGPRELNGACGDPCGALRLLAVRVRVRDS